MNAIVTWTKDWSAAPFVDAADCRHPGPAALAIGAELVRERPGGPGRMETRALFCMLCGTDSSGRLPPEEALQAAWQEHGWHASTRDRLLAFAQLPIEPQQEGDGG